MAVAKNQTELADLVGRDQGTLSRLIRRPDWPTRKRGPWRDPHIEAIKVWIQTLQDNRAGMANPESELGRAKLQAEILYKHATTELTKLRREILEGGYVPRDQLDGSLGGLAKLFIQSLDDLERRHPELATELDDARRVICERSTYELVTVTELVKEHETKLATRRGRPAAASQ